MRTSKFILDSLALFFKTCFVNQLVFEEDLLLQGTRILGFNIGETRRNRALRPFQVIVTHFQLPQLNLDLLMVLP